MPGISDIFISALLGSSAAITTKSTSTQKIRSLDDMSYVDANYKRKKLKLRCKIKTLLIFLANQVIKILFWKCPPIFANTQFNLSKNGQILIIIHIDVKFKIYR